MAFPPSPCLGQTNSKIGALMRSSVFSALVSSLAVLICGLATPAAAVETGSASGLPVPRFVSLKSDHVNVRGGPTKDHEVSWVYTRSGLPVEVTAEFENWRRVPRLGRCGRLGLSLFARGPSHRRRHDEIEGRSRRAL